MKRKIIFAIATSFFAMATVFNMNMLESSNASDISLEHMVNIANATTEIYGGTLPGATIYGVDLSGGTTAYTGNNGYPSIQWYSYWFRTDPSGQSGTQAEINKMRQDLNTFRRPSTIVTTNPSTTNSYGGSGGWNIGFNATANYSHSNHSGTIAVSRSCCVKEQYVRTYCTHLPPCEMYI